ncbi:MAG TPA: hypothetical protein VEO01_01525 [Pseudonocardiaceae bacterium]|nr:hypothetical protein [Pseudonocardiaceae bacterium]
MSRRRWSVVLVFGVALAVVTACSGPSTPAPATGSSSRPAPKAVNIPGALPGSQVENAVKSAFSGATAVHIKGTLTNSTGTLSLDLQLNKDNTAAGTISEGGAAIPLIAVNGKFYVQFTPEMISKSTNASVGQLGSALSNKWVSSDSSLASAMVAGLKPLLNFDSFVSSMFGQASEVPTLTGTDVVNNLPVYTYESADGSVVYVGKAGPHYLARMTAPATGSGSIDFTGWNQPVPVTPPPASAIYTGPGA